MSLTLQSRKLVEQRKAKEAETDVTYNPTTQRKMLITNQGSITF